MILISKEEIRNSVNRKIIALKNDQVEFVKSHDEDFWVYRNLRTGELFITRKENISETDEVGVLILAEKDKKTSINKKKNSSVASEKSNQISMF